MIRHCVLVASLVFSLPGASAEKPANSIVFRLASKSPAFKLKPILQQIRDGSVEFTQVDLSMSPDTVFRASSNSIEDPKTRTKLLELHSQWKCVADLFSGCASDPDFRMHKNEIHSGLGARFLAAMEINRHATEILAVRYFKAACESGNFSFASQCLLNIQTKLKPVYRQQVSGFSKPLEDLFAEHAFWRQCMNGPGPRVYAVLRAYRDSNPSGRQFHEYAKSLDLYRKRCWKKEDPMGAGKIVDELLELAGGQEAQPKNENEKGK